jgi:hypothetical protein
MDVPFLRTIVVDFPLLVYWLINCKNPAANFPKFSCPTDPPDFSGILSASRGSLLQSKPMVTPAVYSRHQTAPFLTFGDATSRPPQLIVRNLLQALSTGGSWLCRKLTSTSEETCA